MVKIEIVAKFLGWITIWLCGKKKLCLWL